MKKHVQGVGKQLESEKEVKWCFILVFAERVADTSG